MWDNRSRELRVQVGKGGLLVKLQYFWDSYKKQWTKTRECWSRKKWLEEKGWGRERERERHKGETDPCWPLRHALFLFMTFPWIVTHQLYQHSPASIHTQIYTHTNTHYTLWPVACGLCRLSIILCLIVVFRCPIKQPNALKTLNLLFFKETIFKLKQLGIIHTLKFYWAHI